MPGASGVNELEIEIWIVFVGHCGARSAAPATNSNDDG